MELGRRVTGETDYYRGINGKEFKGIPFTLLMIMFTSWAKNVYDVEKYIDDFYALVNAYLDLASEHIPTDRIPGT